MSFTPLNQPDADINGTASTMTPDSVDDMDPQVKDKEEEQDVVRCFLSEN